MSAPFRRSRPKTYATMPPIDGVRIATAEAGIKYKNRTDLLVMAFDEGTEVAGVFTRSKCPSAPVDLCRANLGGGRARVLVVNSGNANAFTGKSGRESTGLTAQGRGEGRQAARAARFSSPRPASSASRSMPGASRICSTEMAAKAERRPLGRRRQGDHDHRHLSEIRDRDGQARRRRRDHQRHRQGRRHDRARHGDDAVLRRDRCADRRARAAGAAVGKASAKTFNAVTVDSDTSTSDTLLLFATGAAAKRGAPAHQPTPRIARIGAFRRGLNKVLKSLALQVVRDGEGARKQVEVTVTGAKSARSAKRIALSIANSPLVKTAVAGEDANWGRVVMAVGKAGEPADRDLLSIWFGDIRVAHQGERDPDYSEEATSAYMKREDITIRADIGLGRGKATVWTCDLTKEYVEINGDYRS